MFEHARFALTGFLAAAQSYTFGSVLGANLNDGEKIMYMNAFMECKRLEALAMGRFDGSIGKDETIESLDFGSFLEDNDANEGGKTIEDGRE